MLSKITAALSANSYRPQGSSSSPATGLKEVCHPEQSEGPGFLLGLPLSPELQAEA
jgi:hypothetical protein